MPPVAKRREGRARSSAGEHCLHTAGVDGSIPSAPTIIFNYSIRCPKADAHLDKRMGSRRRHFAPPLGGKLPSESGPKLSRWINENLARRRAGLTTFRVTLDQRAGSPNSRPVPRPNRVSPSAGLPEVAMARPWRPPCRRDCATISTGRSMNAPRASSTSRPTCPSRSALSDRGV
jgi:hypothetical protein